MTAHTTSPCASVLITRHECRGMFGPLNASAGNGAGRITPSPFICIEYALRLTRNVHLFNCLNGTFQWIADRSKIISFVQRSICHTLTVFLLPGVRVRLWLDRMELVGWHNDLVAAFGMDQLVLGMVNLADIQLVVLAFLRLQLVLLIVVFRLVYLVLHPIMGIMKSNYYLSRPKSLNKWSNNRR